MTTQPRRELASQGFSLVELLLALGLGLTLSAAMLRLLLGSSDTSQAISRWMRETSVQQRAIALLEHDLRTAQQISPDPLHDHHACPLSGRLPVLHLSLASGSVTWSIGAPPSGIWRGQVLMRCGPAYRIDGTMATESSAQNRVVMDGLSAQPRPWSNCGGKLNRSLSKPIDLAGSSSRSFSACLDRNGALLAVRLLQDLPLAGRRPHVISQEAVLAAGSR